MTYDFSPRLRSRVTRTLGLLVAGTLTLASLAACGSESGRPGSGGAATGEKSEVLGAFYPLSWLSRQIGGQDITVSDLTKPGAEPHDLELTPRQVVQVGEARLVVYIKGIQPAVDEAVAEHAPKSSLDAASLVKTIPAGESDAHAHEGGHEGEHGHEEHGNEEHEHGGVDPHIWLDPDRMATVATGLGERLAAADPAHAAGYRERAAKTAASLRALDGEFKTALATCATRTLVTSHAAFGYLANRYGLKQVGISGVEPDSEPTPSRLAKVADLAKREKVRTIFFESLVNPKVAQVLAEEVGARTEVLDPLESPPKDGDYLTAMRQNLNHIRAGLECR
ncbi:metal ABC transporter substrate-binding protein [Bailinhaonella thermotolerans]|uniref:metal ABC transporter substrate-binding protein n=1 Tax=Bailinhaonella thermotolerans TaxID=1070861 RepID=UPI001F5B52DF|nr:metal ABC transporter substrate-binding protein [Bailinhaonella thermotolerans]